MDEYECASHTLTFQGSFIEGAVAIDTNAIEIGGYASQLRGARKLVRYIRTVLHTRDMPSVTEIESVSSLISKDTLFPPNGSQYYKRAL